MTASAVELSAKGVKVDGGREQGGCIERCGTEGAPFANCTLGSGNDVANGGENCFEALAFGRYNGKSVRIGRKGGSGDVLAVWKRVEYGRLGVTVVRVRCEGMGRCGDSATEELLTAGGSFGDGSGRG